MLKQVEDYPRNFVNAMVGLVIELTFLAVVFGVAWGMGSITFVVLMLTLVPLGKVGLSIAGVVGMVVFLAAMMAGYAGGQKLKVEVKRGSMMSERIKE